MDLPVEKHLEKAGKAVNWVPLQEILSALDAEETQSFNAISLLFNYL
jgi:hypothetical protein